MVAWFALVISVLAFIVGAWSLLYFNRQAAAAQSQADSAKQQTLALGQQLQLTEQQLHLAERLRKEQFDPYVIVGLRPRSTGSLLLCLAIVNTGPTVARDVTVKVDPPLRSSLGDKAEESLARALARTIPSLPPGQELLWMLDTGPGLFGSPDLPRQYTFTVDATGPSGPVEPMTYLVDLAVLEGTVLNSETAEGSLGKIADRLDALTKAVGRRG